SVADAQLARDDLHGRLVAAVAVEQHELAKTGARDRAGGVQPASHRRLGVERKRSGKGEMLARRTDLEARQAEDGKVIRQKVDRAVEDAGVDAGVDRDRKVRTVLLDR